MENIRENLSAWNTTSIEQRLEIANEVLSENIEYQTARHDLCTGRAQVIEDMATFHERFPGRHFEIGGVSSHHNVALLTWVIIQADGKEFARGRDQITVDRNGRISKITTFAPSANLRLELTSVSSFFLHTTLESALVRQARDFELGTNGPIGADALAWLKTYPAANEYSFGTSPRSMHAWVISDAEGKDLQPPFWIWLRPKIDRVHTAQPGRRDSTICQKWMRRTFRLFTEDMVTQTK
ncbi:nuclear transport factor 2 family protein [Bradyrhizobium sp. STM 3562]|uniref:nuclear transport factor 2 family protein n=1 Tax=Bradyrhizobium sp. STM 3562 TaxID=578924 RepID=UPI00388EB2FB